MSAYYIRSIAQQDLVLSAYDDKAVVSWIDPSLKDTTQQWTMESVRIGIMDTTVFTNVGTGGKLTIRSDQRGAAISVGGQGTPWLIKDLDIGRVIQPLPDNNLVLNLIGPHFENQSRAALWDWTGGQSNELWQIEDVAFVAPYVTQEAYLPSGTPTLALWETQDHQVIVGDFPNVPNPPNDEMLWNLTIWTSGISLQNKKSKKWLACDVPGAPLVTNKEMSSQSVWSLENTNTTWWFLGFWRDTNLTVSTKSSNPVNRGPVEARGRDGSDGQVWKIEARDASGAFHNFVYKPRTTKIVG